MPHSNPSNPSSRQELPKEFLPLLHSLEVFELQYLTHFDPVIAQRGVSYADDGLVSGVHILSCTKRELTIQGVVKGTRTYAVTCAMTIRNSKSKLRPDVNDMSLSMSCSCPYPAACKHAAALLTSFFDESWADEVHSFLTSLPGAQTKSKEVNGEIDLQPLSVDLSRKLDGVARDKAALPHLMAPRFKVGFGLCIFGGRQATILDWEIHPLILEEEDAGLRPSVHHNQSYTETEFYRICVAGGISFTAEDGALLAAFLSQKAPNTPAGISKQGHLLLKAIESGKCFLQHEVFPHRTPLSLGPPISVTLGWNETATGNRNPAVLNVDDEVKFFATNTIPVYIRTSSLVIGPVVLSDPSVNLLNWLALPPAKPAQALSLLTHLRSKKLPVAGLEDVAEKHNLPEETTPKVCVTLFATPIQVATYGWPAYLPSSPSELPVLSPGEVVIPPVHAVRLTFRYGEIEVSIDSDQMILRSPSDPNILLMRNTQFESACHSALTDLDLVPLSRAHTVRGMEAKGLLALNDPHRSYRARLYQLARTLIQLGKDRDWSVVVPDNLLCIEVAQNDWSGGIVEVAGSDWFEGELQITTQGRTIDLGEVLVSLLKNEPHQISSLGLSTSEKCILAIGDTCIEIERARLTRLLQHISELSDLSTGKPRFSRFSAYAFESALQSQFGKWESGTQIAALRARIAEMQQPKHLPEPAGFKGNLRDYQQEGVAWLSTISTSELGGILADDMGLGKTVQIIAFMLHERAQGRMNPTLVVCPKSVVPNWIAELHRFAPELAVYRATGNARAKSIEHFPSVDIIITSYPLLSRDSALLSKIDFNLAVFDEAQQIKNPETLAYGAAVNIKARTKIPVSGTPVENNLKDLWAHLNLTMPGFLASYESFKRSYRIPIEKHGMAEVRENLAARIKPFILRRTKHEVAKELPPLTEIVTRCSLEGDQRDLYETIRQLTTKKVREALAQKGAKRSHIEFLEALLKLRQVCCDPRLVKTSTAKKVKQSSKFEVLMQMIPELIEEGRSVVLFSQFTEMLALIEEGVRKLKIPYCMLTGQTNDREGPVTLFQSGEVKLFLMSLKAGGVGINLTAADTIIIYDPWWNPAVESQAVCRAHRIGQTKPVFAYRIIAEGTIEEKILDLQERKRSLVENILSENEQPPELSPELVDFLFAPLG